MLLLSNIKHCKYVVSCCIFNFETPKLRRIYINIAYTRKFAIFITKFRELISHQRFGIRINLFLIQLWKCYNLHIIQIINSVDKNRLDSYWCDFTGVKVTLQEMIEGYLGHLHLHIKEIHELID